jgi:hypothetical protein
MLPTIDMSEPMQEAIPAFVAGSDLAHWSCCTTRPTTSAALTDAFLSFSGAPFFVLVNMSASCFRRYEGTMRESAEFFDAAPTLPCLERRDPSNGDNRNFVHMKVMVDAGHPLHPRFAKTLCGGGLFLSLFKGSALKMRIPRIVSTKSESSIEGDRGRHGLFRAGPFQAVSQRAPTPGSAYRKPSRCFMMPRAGFITNTSHILPTDGWKDLKSISN